ncbi:hypothetical protein Glove_104g45 [Diversispora epigaea]|uniref:Uncharacterized protein n=1 Tax=Diversispora epigaea TaxID=1348612 RepID=A0A397J9T4_9GLOM|nr:hypothetical protein Glove_104g45 [Diversispora epigaea]
MSDFNINFDIPPPVPPKDDFLPLTPPKDFPRMNFLGSASVGPSTSQAINFEDLTGEPSTFTITTTTTNIKNSNTFPGAKRTSTLLTNQLTTTLNEIFVEPALVINTNTNKTSQQQQQQQQQQFNHQPQTPLNKPLPNSTKKKKKVNELFTYCGYHFLISHFSPTFFTFFFKYIP